MAEQFQKEIVALVRAKRLVSLLPQRLRFRAAKALYNYESEQINGVDLVVPLQNNGLLCFVSTKDLIGWKIFFFGEYEADTNRVLAKYIKPGDTVIEAGANIGSETLLISKLIGSGKLFAFEPNPYTFERMKMNLQINELTNVEACDIALGEQDGVIHFNIYPKNFCNSGMSSKYMETSRTRKIDIVQQKLDSFVQQHGIAKVDFIKMDIQGAEMDMISGGLETIRRDKPSIFTEACEPYNDTKLLYRTLKDCGYNIYLIGAHDTILMENEASVKDGNWLAMPAQG